MALSGNKGEWSEIYALFKLLGDGRVYAGDADMNLNPDICYPIINIIREETTSLNYKPNNESNVIIEDENGEVLHKIPMSKFSQEADELYNKICSTNVRAFEIPDTELFMTQIGCNKIKAPSKDKSDIHIVLHDFRTGMNPRLGFSIKSQLGSPSTLLNAGDTTNIRYKIVGNNLTDDEVRTINAIPDHQSRMLAVLNNNCRLEYDGFDSPVFKNNLMFIDSCLPEFIALCLKTANLYSSSKNIKNIVCEVAESNPFDFKGDNVVEFYEHKMKQLLLNSALGMTPATSWNGKFDANGGYLVVKRDGDIVCYHFYNINDVEDYLYNNTRFENASRGRYKFGSLYKDNTGDLYIKLNLQIRFVR